MTDTMLNLSLSPTYIDAEGNRVVCGAVRPCGMLEVRILPVCGGVVVRTVNRQWMSDAVQSGRLTYLGEQ